MIQSKQDLLVLSDEKIQTFFDKAVFSGKFNSEILSKNHKDWYCGSFVDIKVNGQKCDFCPKYFNVSNRLQLQVNDIYEFKCRVNIEALRSNGLFLSIDERSIKRADFRRRNITPRFFVDERTQDLFDRWGVNTCEFIGYYRQDEEGHSIIEDIRKVNFARMPHYPDDVEKKPVTIFVPQKIQGIRPGDYYRFRWKLLENGKRSKYQIGIDFSFPPQDIDPKWFIDNLFDDRHNDKSKNFESTIGFLDTLSKQLSARESTFIYELLQNANDYPVKVMDVNAPDKERSLPVDVEFHITDNYLLFLHSGDYFNVRNISGICGINEKEKTANRKAIGYKGIGFKTVFLNNHYVYIRTGDYSFRFDEHAEKIKRVEAPWPILPVWTDRTELDREVEYALVGKDRQFRVQIALRPDSPNVLYRGKNAYVKLFTELFEDSNIILFIPNINSVKVYIKGELVRSCLKDENVWTMNSYDSPIDRDLQEKINKTIDTKKSRIPEKYKDFEATQVSFACKHEGRKIVPLTDENGSGNGLLYCYLPTSTSWGFPFLLNTDMIPKGDRDDIEYEVKLNDEEETNFNLKIASIAGQKFFDWIKELMTSGYYEPGSVFGLIPDFDKCIKEHKEYKEFIECFKEGFESRLKTEPIIPVAGGFNLIENVILDETGLTDGGVIEDDDYYKIYNATWDDGLILPHKIIRNNASFRRFFKRYCDNQTQILTFNYLNDMLDQEEFKNWLKIEDNNHKFLAFLLVGKRMTFCKDKAIFLDQNGEIQKAEDLYFDVDNYLDDIKYFEDYFIYLSKKTREHFASEKKFEEIAKGFFLQFDADNFVDNILLDKNNIEEVKEKLREKEVSLHFYHFLADNVGYTDKYMQLPVLSDCSEESFIDNFTDSFVFFSSSEGNSVKSAAWFEEEWISFISNEYCDSVKEMFANHFGVENFSHEKIVEDIILSKDYCADINDLIQNDISVNKKFVDYCYQNREYISDSDLIHYALSAVDVQGNSDFYLIEDHIYFEGGLFDEYSQRQWIDEAWMYQLDPVYYKELDNEESQNYKSFLESAFGIISLTEEEFYTEIVKKNIKSILANISGNNDLDGSKNFDFVKYLDSNYKLIFEDYRDESLFSGLVLVNTDVHDIDSSDNHRYLYDEELCTLTEQAWFPKALLNMCNKAYGKSKALEKINIKPYIFKDFFEDFIVKELDSIASNIRDKETNVAFHNFIIENRSKVAPDLLKSMKDLPVFLYGHDTPVDSAGYHKILSQKAKELFEKGLVEPGDLDIIDPVYNTDKCVEYWETSLGNAKFTVSDFIDWLIENDSTFSSIIQSKDANITFWRWAKENISSKSVSKLPVLPVLVTGDSSVCDYDETIYLSSAYLQGSGIESIVRRYDEDAVFISNSYICPEDDVNSWKEFWTNVGLHSEIIDILTETVIPNLSDLDDENLPSLLVQYKSILETKYDDLASELSDLRLKAIDGQFYPVKDIVFVDCDSQEPFVYIQFPNQVNLRTSEERRLIRDIVDSVDATCIDNLIMWNRLKIERYVELQDNDDENITDIHNWFIAELASMYREDKNSLRPYDNLKDDVLLYGKDGEWHCCSDLTLGHAYNPFCDFENNGVDDLEYISEQYADIECVNRMFNRVFRLHCEFTESDICRLDDNRTFAEYFWSVYLKKEDTPLEDIKDLIKTGKFNSFKCIPNNIDDGMCVPSDLYSREISYFTKHIASPKENTILDSLDDIEYEGVSLFGLLPFKKQLDFEDALYSLYEIKAKEKRQTVISWMLSSYETYHNSLIDEYRDQEEAKWNNKKNDSVQIKSLYALPKGNKMLDQYFGNNVHIINPDFLPSGDAYAESCEMLKVPIIDPSELSIEPKNSVCENDRIKPFLKLCTLVIAGIEEPDNWKEKYEEYLEKLEELNLFRCDSILLIYKYNSEISQNLKRIYHADDDSSDIYYVNSIRHNRVFTPFVTEFIAYMDIQTEEDIVLEILESEENAIDSVRDHNQLMLDEEFKDALDEFIPGIKRELFGYSSESVEDDDPSDEQRKVFKADKKNAEEEDTDSEDSSETDAGSYYTDPAVDDDLSDQDDETESEDDIEEDSEDDIDIETEDEIDVDTDGDDSSDVHVNYPYSGPTDSGGRSNYGNSGGHSNRGGAVGRTPIGGIKGGKPYTNHDGWESKRPRPFSPEDVSSFGSKGHTREMNVSEATDLEIETLNRILGGDLTPEQVADQNYLAQLRLYNSLRDHGLDPEENIEDFIRHGSVKNEHTLHGGKYIHKCSAYGGIMYISPSIWNKIADDRCVVCVYFGARSKDFMYFNSIDDILKWIDEDDIVIKLTGPNKAKVAQALYSGVLRGVKGNAYTLIRINSNEKYDSLFKQISPAMTGEDSLDVVDDL